jgi:hypothetical protein
VWHALTKYETRRASTWQVRARKSEGGFSVPSMLQKTDPLPSPRREEQYGLADEGPRQRQHGADA